MMVWNQAADPEAGGNRIFVPPAGLIPRCAKHRGDEYGNHVRSRSVLPGMPGTDFRVESGIQ